MLHSIFKINFSVCLCYFSASCMKCVLNNKFDTKHINTETKPKHLIRGLIQGNVFPHQHCDKNLSFYILCFKKLYTSLLILQLKPVRTYSCVLLSSYLYFLRYVIMWQRILTATSLSDGRFFSMRSLVPFGKRHILYFFSSSFFSLMYSVLYIFSLFLLNGRVTAARIPLGYEPGVDVFSAELLPDKPLPCVGQT